MTAINGAAEVLLGYAADLLTIARSFVTVEPVAIE